MFAHFQWAWMVFVVLSQIAALRARTRGKKLKQDDFTLIIMVMAFHLVFLASILMLAWLTSQHWQFRETGWLDFGPPNQATEKEQSKQLGIQNASPTLWMVLNLRKALHISLPEPCVTSEWRFSMIYQLFSTQLIWGFGSLDYQTKIPLKSIIMMAPIILTRLNLRIPAEPKHHGLCGPLTVFGFLPVSGKKVGGHYPGPWNKKNQHTPWK